MWLDKPPALFTRYWLLQGILHMNWVERLHRLALELLVAGGVWSLAIVAGQAGTTVLWPLLLAHTLNAVLNGHAIALWGHAYGNLAANKTKDRFVAHLESIAERLNRKKPPFIRDVVIMGSVVRGELRPTSDVDLAVVAAPGLWNTIRAINYLTMERARAFFARFPLDAYVYRSWEELERKMRIREEPPLSLYSSSSGAEAESPEESLRRLRDRIRLAEPVAKAPRVILAGAGGGHLTEALLAVEGVRMKRTIATFCLPHTRDSLQGEVVYCLVDPHGSLLKYARNFLQSLWMVLRVRPHAVLSSGGGMTIAACLIGKFVGAKLIYVESGARVHTLSRTGKLLYRFADLFIVQWPPLAKQYPKAMYGGVLL